MNTNKILSADLLDLVFDDRNKEYGAYELRKTYQKRITKALVITTSVALLAFAGNLLARSSKVKEYYTFVPVGPTIIPIEPDKPPPPPEQKKPEPVQVKKEIFVSPQIVEDKDVKKPPPDQDDLRVAKIDVIKQDGVDFTGIAETSDIDGKKGIIDEKKNDGSNEPYTIVQVEAKFNGNWIKFLERNLNANVPVDNGAAAGRYKVIVQFVVDIDGSVSDIKTLSSNGYGMEEEAVRVLKKAEKWEPAIQNGHQVKAYRKQVIVFAVEE